MNAETVATSQTELKYELLPAEPGESLRRVRALRDIPSRGVRVGDLGGYVEHEGNLSQSGSAWVYGNAQVYEKAQVSGNAQVHGNALVYGNALVSGNTRVHGNARVSGKAQVFGDAWVSGNARVHGKAWVYGNAWVSGNTLVSGNTRMSEETETMTNETVITSQTKPNAVREQGAREARAEESAKHAHRLWKTVSARQHTNAKHGPGEGCTGRCLSFALRHHKGADKESALGLAIDLEWIEERDGRFFVGRSQPAGEDR